MKGLEASDALRDGGRTRAPGRMSWSGREASSSGHKGPLRGAWLDKVDMKPGESAADALEKGGG